MNTQLLLLLPVLLPIIGGIAVGVLKIEERKKRNTFVSLIVLVNLIVTALALYLNHGKSLVLLKMPMGITFLFKIDIVGVVFALLVSILWLLTTFYAFGYMSHEENETRFFTYFTMALGVVLGISFAGNPFTLYLFYEILTLVTYPLVTHSQTEEALKAGKKYILYSFLGAALAFTSISILQVISVNSEYVLNGVLSPSDIDNFRVVLEVFYLIGFLGFGVKAAIFPFHGWLSAAYIAPTPVTALLHAVAVVKSGIFAIIRLTYYGYGTVLLKGSVVQTICMIFIVVTIIYGSSMALRTTHLKKRLAYSTISQLSYILMAVMMLSKVGLVTAIVQMVLHAIIKITLFLCTGNIMFTTGKNYVQEMVLIGKSMTKTMICFTIAALALTGIPPTVGVFSKWILGSAAFGSNEPILGALGIGAIMISTLLTALYLLPFSFKAFFGVPTTKEVLEKKEAPGTMIYPVILLATTIMVLGVLPNLIFKMVDFLNQVL